MAQDLPFNRSEVIANLGGDEALLKEIAALFLTHCDAAMRSIGDALAAGDAEQVFAAAHALKGAVSNFFAHRPSAAALALERCGKSGDLTPAAALFDELKLAIGDLVTALQAEIDA